MAEPDAKPPPWVMRMRWHDLLFMHWPIRESLLRPLLPAGLELDLFDGAAWIGVVPFYMTDVRPRGFPPFLASRFPEINVRTYARHQGRSGVWFFSLDAADRLAVWAARRFYHLPYWLAAMSSERAGEWVRYRSRRAAAEHVAIACQYRPAGLVFHAAPGSLEHWLTERYCLFSANGSGEILRGDVRHAPWPLQTAEAEIHDNTMTLPLGFPLPPDRPLLHFAQRLDVVASQPVVTQR